MQTLICHNIYSLIEKKLTTQMIVHRKQECKRYLYHLIKLYAQFAYFHQGSGLPAFIKIHHLDLQ